MTPTTSSYINVIATFTATIPQVLLIIIIIITIIIILTLFLLLSNKLI